MSRKLINALLMIIGLCAFAHAGGVTNIKSVKNKSSKSVRVTAYDNKTLAENGHHNRITTEVIAPGTDWQGEMWIPWADNAQQFRLHFLTFEIFEMSPRSRGRVLIFGGYQTGEEVRASFVRDRQTTRNEEHYLVESEYNDHAPRVDGEWRSGGDRRIIFFDKPDGSVGFKFEKYGN